MGGRGRGLSITIIVFSAVMIFYAIFVVFPQEHTQHETQETSPLLHAVTVYSPENVAIGTLGVRNNHFEFDPARGSGISGTVEHPTEAVGKSEILEIKKVDIPNQDPKLIYKVSFHQEETKEIHIDSVKLIK